MLNGSEVDEWEIPSILIEHLKKCNVNVFYIIFEFQQLY